VIEYDLSEPAAVTLRIQRARPGRRVRGRCVRPTRRNRRRPKCTRFVRAGRPLQQNGAAGANSLPLRRLATGRYRVVANAVDAAGNAAKPVRVSFRVR
jgi:hypothetical protein